MPKLEADSPMSGKKYNLFSAGDWLDGIMGVVMWVFMIAMGLKVAGFISNKTGLTSGGNILGVPTTITTTSQAVGPQEILLGGEA